MTRKTYPLLSRVAPQTFAICAGYAVVNFFLGFGLALFYSSTVPLSIVNLLGYREWGIGFLVTAIFTTFGLIFNNWWVIKQTQLLGITLKATWAVALIIRSFSAPPTVLITVVWLFLTYIQAVTYIYFPHDTNGALGDIE